MPAIRVGGVIICAAFFFVLSLATQSLADTDFETSDHFCREARSYIAEMSNDLEALNMRIMGEIGETQTQLANQGQRAQDHLTRGIDTLNSISESRSQRLNELNTRIDGILPMMRQIVEKQNDLRAKGVPVNNDFSLMIWNLCHIALIDAAEHWWRTQRDLREVYFHLENARTEALRFSRRQSKRDARGWDLWQEPFRERGLEIIKHFNDIQDELIVERERLFDRLVSSHQGLTPEVLEPLLEQHADKLWLDINPYYSSLTPEEARSGTIQLETTLPSELRDELSGPAFVDTNLEALSSSDDRQRLKMRFRVITSKEIIDGAREQTPALRITPLEIRDSSEGLAYAFGYESGYNAILPGRARSNSPHIRYSLYFAVSGQFDQVSFETSDAHIVSVAAAPMSVADGLWSDDGGVFGTPVIAVSNGIAEITIIVTSAGETIRRTIELQISLVDIVMAGVPEHDEQVVGGSGIL